MVAACISAETGVGPSMASGSQTWKGTCALLPAAPKKTRKAARASSPVLTPLSPPSAMVASISVKLNEPVRFQTRKIPSRNPKSATRLVRNAFLPASTALGFST